MSVDSAITRLVNGLLVPGLCGDVLPAWIEREADNGLTAVCWFSGESLGELTSRLPDLMVLADEEGGNVTRLEAAQGSSWPGNAALGVIDDVTVTEQVAGGIAAMARRAGIDVVLAPVVDVNSEPDNPVIGVRSFGAETELVARHGAAFVRGVQSQGVAACAKHFPGHGATRTDSHLALPVVDADRATFLSRDVAPFAAAIDAGVRCVLTAHVAVPAVDPTAATMSATWMSMLRGELGFGGVVISDALDMHAIAHGVGRAPGGVKALLAGVDLLCIGNPCFPEHYDSEAVFLAIVDEIVRAVAAEELPPVRLEEAAARVGALKEWLASAAPLPRAPGVEADTFGGDVARRAVRGVGEIRLDAPPHVVVEQRTDIAAGVRPTPIVAALTARAPATTSAAVSGVDEVTAALEPAIGRHVVLVTDRLAGDAVLETIRALRPDTVVIDIGPASDHVAGPAVMAHGNGAATASAVAELLFPN
jgi:beta-N-acetylhexosaminidase